MMSPRSLAAGIMLAVHGTAFGQGAIEVRAHATIQPGAPVRLADIAILTGDAAALADTTIADGPGRLTIDAIRAALEQDQSLEWDQLVIRGRACTVRAAGQAHSQPAKESVGLEFAPAAALTDDGTIRGLVASTLARELKVEPDDLRCAFDPADRELLAKPVGHQGSSVEVRSLASGDVRPVLVNIYTPSGVIDTATVRVRVEVRRTAATASHDVPRGRVITSEDVTIGPRWTPPGASLAAPESVIGGTVQQRLAAGELVEESDLTRPFAVKKGEILLASCVQGGFAVEVRARATASARDGEELSLQSLDRRHTFRARVSGPGRAVVIDHDPEPPTREPR